MNLNENFQNLSLEGQNIERIGIIGEGSYGKVYECKTSKGIRVAKKTIRHGKNGMELLSEATLLKTINHVNLINAKEIVVKETRTSIITDLAETDMFKWRNKNTPTPDLCVKWLFEIMQGVYCLHKFGFIHADIKSSNILLKNNTAIVADLTLAIRNDWVIKANWLACTETHRPIEVFISKDWSYEVDLWAIGCTMFELLFNRLFIPIQSDENKDKDLRYLKCMLDWSKSGYVKRLPVEIEKYLESKTKHINNYKKFNLPESFDPINNKLHRIILNCLEPDRNNRYSLETHLTNDLFSGLLMSPIGFEYEEEDTIDKTIKSIILNKIKQYSMDDIMILQTYRIACKIYDMKRVSFENKIEISYWLAHKLIYSVPEIITVGSTDNTFEKMKKLEIRVWDYLGGVLPILNVN